jgi:hypothetical protein
MPARPKEKITLRCSVAQQSATGVIYIGTRARESDAFRLQSSSPRT